MEQLKSMKEQLTSMVQGQLCNAQNVDAKELGEAVDMIKDLAEAIYYCNITEAMEKGKEKEKYQQPSQMIDMPYRNYRERYLYPYYRDVDKQYGKMYYSDERMRNNSMDRNYSDGWEVYPIDMQDYREGVSHRSRKTYMESKETHQDKEVQMKELDKYMQELSQDITEMIYDADPEEKQLLRTKLSNLINKI